MIITMIGTYLAVDEQSRSLRNTVSATRRQRWQGRFWLRNGRAEGKREHG
jgi:hypothetical protein